jgi:tRNA-specific 2-thiouridylase
MTVTGIGLMSGGLDSMLAARLLMEQGIEVVGISFTTPFFDSGKAETAARRIGFPLLVSDITENHLVMVKNPPSGYGKNMNPCIDCHAMMVLEAGRVMEREGWDFIFTGEVLNERPMSQTRHALNRVANLSGYGEHLLRPLSALLLRETAPEKDGKVDRSRLLDIQGRSRKRQFALAREYDFPDYPSPGGGCLLTDPGFSRRLRDLFDEGPGDHTRLVEMLKVGRHFRLRRGVKAVVGRNKGENGRLLELRGPGDVIFETVDIPGPVVLLTGDSSEADRLIAAGLCVRYSDAREGPAAVVVRDGEREETLRVPPLDEGTVESWRL